MAPDLCKSCNRERCVCKYASMALPPAPTMDEQATKKLIEYLREHAARDFIARVFLDTLERGDMTAAQLALTMLPAVLEDRRRMQELALRFTGRFSMPGLKF